MAKPKGIKVGAKVRLAEDFPPGTSQRSTFTVIGSGLSTVQAEG